MTTAQDLTLEKHHGEKYVLEMLVIQLLTIDWAFRICFVGPTVQIFKLAQFIENVQTYLYKTGVSSRI